MATKFDTSGLAATDGRLQQLLRAQAERARLDDARRRLASRSAVRPKTAEEAGIIRAAPSVQVRWVNDPNAPDDWYVQVAVFSLMRPGNLRRTLISEEMYLTSQSPRGMLGVAAGACCESLCEDGDPYDPADAVRMAEELHGALPPIPPRA